MPQLLMQVARKDLRVARLIHHLGGGIELGIHPGHGGGQLSGHKHGQLLPMQKLAEVPGKRFIAQPLLLLGGQLTPEIRVP